MKVSTFRDDAMADVGPNGNLLVRGVLVSQFTTPARIAPLNVSTEAEFKPGVIYKIYTGLAIDDVKNPFNLTVRAVISLFKHGLEVKRVDLEERNEIVIYATTMVPFKFVKNESMFEVAINLGGSFSIAGVEIKPESVAATPGPFQKETLHLKEVVQAAAQAQGDPAQAASDEKKVKDWLESPDTKGKEIGVETQPVSKPFTGTAAVANTGPNASSAVDAKLSGKLGRL